MLNVETLLFLRIDLYFIPESGLCWGALKGEFFHQKIDKKLDFP